MDLVEYFLNCISSMNGEDIYVSLDEAREEIKKRWADTDLKKRIEDELGEKFMSQFYEIPRTVSFRQVCSPDNGFTFFCQCSNYIGAMPIVLEYHEDIFTHLNEDKKGLGRLRVTLEDGSTAMVDVMNFSENEKNKLGECVLKNGESLIDFHHNLVNLLGYKVDFLENSDWFKNIGKASDYYYYLLLHFVAHGALCELFFDVDESNIDFAQNIILPAIEKIQNKFGLKPLIIRQYPQNQTDLEDFYWWSYPPNVNEFIIDYAVKNNLSLKNINLK